MQPELPLPSPFQASAKLHTCLSLCVNPKPFTHSDLLFKELLWESGGREADAYLGQRKTETELKLWRGIRRRGRTGGMTQPVQNQIPCLPPGLLPHLFYSILGEESTPTWGGKVEELICKAK